MKLVIITGFLGSGKTTMLLELLRDLSSDGGRNLVVIENEVGEVGIDGAYLETHGLKVKELYSGCVCCQLAGSLVTTLNELNEALGPECVFLETSGLANLKNVLSVIEKYCEVLRPEEVLTVSLMDIERSELIFDNPMPVITNQITMADIVALNKVDTSGEGEVERVAAELEKMNPEALVIPMSAAEGENLTPILNRLRAWI